MRRERGNQLYVAGATLLVLVAIVVAGLWYIGKVKTEAFAAGEVAERGRWQARESEELRMANAALVASRAKNVKLEQQAAQDLVALDEEHLQEVARVETAKDRFVADVVAGRIRLLDPGRAAGKAADCAGGPGAAAAAGERDAEAGGDLPAALRGRVVAGAELAAEADEVTIQLTAAQRVIEVYRRTCKQADNPS